MDKADKQADLAGPGVSTYEEVAKILPDDYEPLQTPMERMKALCSAKEYIEKNLSKELNLQMVQVPLIVDRDSGINDYLDRDGSRTPVEFPCGLGLKKPLRAQIVQAATKWKRMALKQFDCKVGEGICTDMLAVRKDYFLDHDHSAYVDQWDWERVITEKDRNIDFLKDIVKKIWKVLYGAAKHAPNQQVSGFPRGTSILPCRGNSRPLPRPAAETARDQDDPGSRSGHLYHRHRLGSQGRVPPRDAGRGLRRLGS
jgi:aspartate--ammonia ligase